MRELAEYVLLGFIQGATEFLPISSSAHVLAAKEILNVRASAIVLEICLHFGTLLAILVVLRRELWSLIADTFNLNMLNLLVNAFTGHIASSQVPLKIGFRDWFYDMIT